MPKKIIKREAIKVYKSAKHFFLEIQNEFYDIYRSFPSLEKLINHLKKYPVENINKVIREIRRNNS